MSCDFGPLPSVFQRLTESSTTIADRLNIMVSLYAPELIYRLVFSPNPHLNFDYKFSVRTEASVWLLEAKNDGDIALYFYGEPFAVRRFSREELPDLRHGFREFLEKVLLLIIEKERTLYHPR